MVADYRDASRKNVSKRRIREIYHDLTFDKERVAHWLKVGAQPSDRLAKFFAQAELMKPRERREQTKKNQPKAKAQEQNSSTTSG